MPYARYTPRPPLSGAVACLWYWEGAPQGHSKEQLMPNGEASIIFNLREEPLRIYSAQNHSRFESYGSAVLSGPRTSPFVIDTAQQEKVFGIQFRPGGAWPFFSAPIAALAGSSFSLDDLWRDTAHELRERLLAASCPAQMFALAEQYLVAGQLRPIDPPPALRFAVEYFCRNPHHSTVACVVDQIALSHRRFAQLFSDHIGLSPKAFSRVRRFQRVLALVHRSSSVDWAQIALACGYYDQPHFNHDFQEFSGLTPSLYLTRATEHLNHVPLS